MSALYPPFTFALVLLTCALTSHCCQCAPTADPAGPGRGVHDFRRMGIIRRAEENRVQFSTVTTAPHKVSAAPLRVVRTMKPDRDQTTALIFHRDPRKKELFLIHIAGPLYFSPKCRKHVHRLYHQTRDCTIPAYYKRCARLLTRLAGSPQCT